MLPTERHQEELIDGYMREQSKSTNYNIPLCLNKSIYKFYNEITFMKFKRDEFKSFVATKPGEYWEMNPVMIKGIMFDCALYPNGITPASTGNLQIAIKVHFQMEPLGRSD